MGTTVKMIGRFTKEQLTEVASYVDCYDSTDCLKETINENIDGDYGVYDVVGVRMQDITVTLLKSY